MLSQLSGRLPQDVILVRGPYGKPELKRGQMSGPVAFNLSHSEEMVVFGVTNGPDVGVDVEKIREDQELFELVEPQFAETEQAALREEQGWERARLFFRCWTRKEAYLKGRGLGLSLPLAGFSVDPCSAQAPRIKPDEGRAWTVRDLSLPDGYAGAVAVQGEELQVGWADWFDPGADVRGAVQDARRRK